MAKINLEIDMLNQAYWDELASVHERSYDLKKLFNKESLLNNIEKNELGDLRNKKILHLQCHIGKEAISMALEGAEVTAVDYSFKSIKIAKEIASKVGVDIKFIHSNIYDLLDILDSKFDIIYTSKGVLQWLYSLEKWAKIVSALLSNNGFFYIQEIHPLKYILDDDINNQRFNNQIPLKLNNFDYSKKEYLPKNSAYEYRWSLEEIISSITKAGMKIEFIHEIKKLFYNGFPNMIQDSDGWWLLSEDQNSIPLTFSIKSWKK